MCFRVPVSVVIPAYNEERRIGEAIASVRAQTVAPLELVVVSDGSTDRTAEIARTAGARVIEQPNGGLSAARNAGIRAAYAPWVALLDADDHFFADKLERLWAAHERRPEVDLLLSDFSIVGRGRVLAKRALQTAPQYRRMPRERIAEDVVLVRRRDLCGALAVGNFLSSSSLLVKRKLIYEHDLFYDRTLPSNDECHVAEDIEWYLRVLRWTDAIVVERPLVDYVRHASNISARNGRIRCGDAKLGELIASAPERYAPDAAASFRSARHRHLRRAGFDWMRENDLAQARRAFGEAFANRPAPDTALLWAATLLADNTLGRRSLAGSRDLWRRAKAARLPLSPRT